MTASAYDASVPVFLRGLEVLADLLATAQRHVRDTSMDPATLVDARLAPDMFTLAGQVQRASDTTKLSVARLTGTTFPSFADDETILDALQERVARTAALLRGVTPAAFEHSEDREISIGSGAGKRVFNGTGYLFGFGLPNFYFHLATAYGLLRHHGVALGKRDFLGDAGKVTPAPAPMQPSPER